MEVGNWWGNSWQPSSRQNQFGLAIQGLQEAAGTAGDQIKSYGSNLLKSLTEESDEKKTDLHQSAESLMGVVGAGPLDLAAEFALSQIHRLPEHLRTPAVVTSLLIGSLDGGVPQLRGNNARRINNLLGINSVGTGTSYHANPQPSNSPPKKQAIEAVQSLRKLQISGNGNGHEDDLAKINTSTPVIDKEAFNQLTHSGEIVSSELDGLYKQIEIAKSNLRPGKSTSPQLTKLKQLVSEAKRRKSIIQTTLPDEDFLKFHKRFIDELADAGDNPEKIRRVLDYNFGRTKIEHNISGSSNMGPDFRLEAHHERYAIESALQLMDVTPAIRKEVLKIQLGRGIRYGDHPANYRGLFRPAHAKAHPLGFSGDSSIELVGELRNLDKNASAQQIADAMHKVALNSNKLSLEAAQSKIQIQTAHDFFEGILSPSEIKYFEKKGVNFADTTSDGWQELRRWVENSGRLKHLGPQSRARYESMALESMNIA